jgi:nitrite reductase/ring-hydroxylating ferredoxin subunit
MLSMALAPIAVGRFQKGCKSKQVTCPWHGATYDVTTGEVLGPPAPQGVARYNVRVEGSDIEVEV